MRWIAACAGIALLSCGGQPAGFSPGGPGGDGGTTHDGAPAAGGTPLPCEVDAVFANNCRFCHQNPPLFGSPMPLMTYEDLHAPSKSNPSVPVFQQVEVRIHDDAKPMPPAPNMRLDAMSSATLDAWIAAGAPASWGASCMPPPMMDGGGPPPPPQGDGGPTTGCVPDTHLVAAMPYTLTSSEQYVCYGVDVPAGPKRHVTQIAVHLDNAQIVHHILLLRSQTSVSGTPTPCDPAPTLGDGMLYAWAPGGNPLVVPPEAGFPQDSTTHYLVQIHYNNAVGLPNPTDSSGFDLCTTDQLRPNDADVVAFGSEAIVLFPHATGEVKACFTAPSSYDGTVFFSAFPHMHKLGKSISTTLRPSGGGAPVDMGTDPSWDFSTQPWLPISATVHTGDVLETDCIWNNTTSNVVTFGQSTDNEMCFSFSAYYPSLGASYGWATPAQSSGACP